MVIFSTLSSFTGFMLFSVAVLVIVGIFDEPIRRFEDRLIARIRNFFSDCSKGKKDDKRKEQPADIDETPSVKSFSGERIA